MDAGRQRDAAREDDLDRNIRYSVNEVWKVSRLDPQVRIMI